MKKPLSIAALIALIAMSMLLTGCPSSDETASESDSSDAEEGDDGHNAVNSLNWPGVYTGTLPCGDCEGMRTVLRIFPDDSYLLQTKYLGRSEQIFETFGGFEWDDAGNTIIFDDADSTTPWMYKVGENRVWQLDLQGKQITGETADRYMLTKNFPSLTGKYWNLLSLGGRRVSPEVGGTWPYIYLREQGRKVEGNTGCNTISGSFQLKAATIISFTGLASTKMACSETETENLMLRAMGLAEYYKIVGDTLYLDESGEMPLLKFQIDYMR